MGATGDFYRLFMVPGMLHCAGGPGANVLATLSAITQWVEQQQAPDMLVATKYRADDPKQPVERVRPLCLFPTHAAWDGKGDRNSPAGYRCTAAK
jgi:feruloyl esterase